MGRVWLWLLGTLVVLGLGACGGAPPEAVGKLLVTTTEDDGPGSLRAVIAGAEPGAVVAFDTDGVFGTPQTIELASQIVLSKALTIEGHGAEAVTVSGANSVRVFHVTAGAVVTIEGLTVADGSAGLELLDLGGPAVAARLGGGIYVDGESSLTLRAAAVVDSEAAATGGGLGMGGGIANVGATLVLREGSLVARSSAGSGGGIASLPDGDRPATTTIEDSSVHDNAADEHGGGIVNLRSALVLDKTVVDGNAATGGGGVSNQEGTLAVRDGSLISGNTAATGAGLYNTGSATVTGGIVGGDAAGAGNVAARGGGIYNEGELVIEAGSQVVGNVADGVGLGFDGGGGIFNLGTTTLESASVVANDAATRGGGIANEGAEPDEGHVVISASTVADNTAAAGAGVHSTGSGALSVVGSTVRGNAATGMGGGIVAVGSSLTISGSTIGGDEPGEENTATLGGGVYCSCSLLVADESRLVRNVASEAGGGLYLVGSAGVQPVEKTIAASRFEGNKAALGGGIYFSYESGRASGVVTLHIVDGTVLHGNAATNGNGGGLYQTQTFGSGGNARTILDAAVVEYNGATGAGGGLANEGGQLTIRNGTIVRGNDAELNGGGLFAGPNVDPSRGTATVVEVSTFEGNGALAGGGIYNRDAELSVTASHFSANEAESDGGAVSIEGGEATIVFANVMIGGAGAGNTARYGGGIYNLDGTVHLTAGTQVVGNVAGLVGGGLFNGAGGTLALAAGTSVTGNLALAPPPAGGGVYDVGTFMNDGTVTNNSPDDIAP
jgi:hypothetical protein